MARPPPARRRSSGAATGGSGAGARSPPCPAMLAALAAGPANPSSCPSPATPGLQGAAARAAGAARIRKLRRGHPPPRPARRAAAPAQGRQAAARRGLRVRRQVRQHGGLQAAAAGWVGRGAGRGGTAAYAVDRACAQLPLPPHDSSSQHARLCLTAPSGSHPACPPAEATGRRGGRAWLVLDNAQRLAGGDLLAALMRAREDTGAEVALMLVGSAPWASGRYLHGTAAELPPKEVPFGAYRPDQLQRVGRGSEGGAHPSCGGEHGLAGEAAAAAARGSFCARPAGVGVDLACQAAPRPRHRRFWSSGGGAPRAAAATCPPSASSWAPLCRPSAAPPTTCWTCRWVGGDCCGCQCSRGRSSRRGRWQPKPGMPSTAGLLDTACLKGK